jgi:hypothetical protein
MMGTRMIKQVKDAIANLNPHEVRDLADKPVSIELYATTPGAYQEMEDFFAPGNISEAKRSEMRGVLHRSGEFSDPNAIEVWEQGVIKPPHAYIFYRDRPERTIQEILHDHPESRLALARHVYPFRAPVVTDVIHNVSKENALFSLATAIPGILPLVSLPWAVGEFASDTAFLTMNQVRMSFQLAAASDRLVGYREQKGELASIIASAFGWRAFARELVGHIPFGGGIIPKAAVAYAGTYVVGQSIERYYRLGYGLSRDERRMAYDAAFESGKKVARALLDTRKSHQPA